MNKIIRIANLLILYLYLSTQSMVAQGFPPLQIEVLENNEEIAFLEGNWVLEVTRYSRDGNPIKKLNSTVSYKRELDGLLYSGTYKGDINGEEKEVIQNWIFYNKVEKKFFDVSMDIVANFEIRHGTINTNNELVVTLDKQLVMPDSGGKQSEWRKTFTNITKDTFNIRHDYSEDGGGTWIVFTTETYRRIRNEIQIFAEMDFFNSLDGTWEGIPADTSFISVLQYYKGNKEHFINVNNDLLSKERKLFSHYEGVYFFNPNTSRIEYTTINKSEIHNGYCNVRNDTLFHYATIRTEAGNIRAYSSAIVKVDDKNLKYYAIYGKDKKIPKLKFEKPLIYRKRE